MIGSLGCLDELPRVSLSPRPTPLDTLSNLQSALAGGPLFVKRDDCTTLAFGGNKVRQLEYYLGEAQQSGADCVLITGAVQSNFVRLAAAGARKLGMDCHIQLENRVPKDDPSYQGSGNVLLDKLLGATIHHYPFGEDEEGADRRLSDIAAKLSKEGRRPYVIPLGPGHKPLGALGYVDAARELLTQIAELSLDLDEIVVPSGSGNTHAGLLFGLRALGCGIAVTGICVRRDEASQIARIKDRCAEIAAFLGVSPAVADDDICLVDRFLAPGYGQLNDATIEAIALLARHEGLFLDPVYSAKAMAGLISRARRDRDGKAFLFIHTGGTPALFAYGESLLGAADRPKPD